MAMFREGALHFDVKGQRKNGKQKGHGGSRLRRKYERWFELRNALC